MISGEDVIVSSPDPPTLYFYDKFILNKKVNLQHLGVTDVIGVANDEHENVYICDHNGGCVHVLSLKGQVKLLYSFGKNQLRNPYSVCVSDGHVYVSDWVRSPFVKHDYYSHLQQRGKSCDFIWFLWTLRRSVYSSVLFSI